MTQPTSNGVPPGFYSVDIPVNLPIGTEIGGDPLMIVPLSNGQLQVTIPHGSIPRAMAMMADALALYAKTQNQQDAIRAQKENDSRIVLPNGMLPPPTPFTRN